jgi:hypothetical protein
MHSSPTQPSDLSFASQQITTSQAEFQIGITSRYIPTLCSELHLKNLYWILNGHLGGSRQMAQGEVKSTHYGFKPVRKGNPAVGWHTTPGENSRQGITMSLRLSTAQ